MTRRKLDTAFPQQSPADTSPSTTTTTAATNATSTSSSSDVSPSIMITVLILAIAVILSASLYLLLRFLRRNRTTTVGSNSSTSTTLPRTVSPPSHRQVSPVIDSLPLFTYDRLTAKNGGGSGGDCAVCLSKFEKNDVLRLLPICCHAFHAECIDTWLSNNLTCPLCRSPIFLSDNELIGKISRENHSGSFRVELGNVSNRHRGTTAAATTTNSGEIRRSYSLGGSFDYVIAVDEDAYAEVPTSGSFRRTSSSEFYKAADITAEQQQQAGALAAEVGTRGGGGSWLKDYLSYSLSSSRTASFRSSGRWFFTGSSRRSTVELPAPNNNNNNNNNNELSELDGASRLGDEIGELFRWLSGA